MLRLGLILYLFIGTTLAGSAMVAALAAGYDTTWPVIISSAVGFVVAAPVAWLVARELYSGE
ncbi:MAG: CTP synthetase [Pseudomonadota bacterium]|uniref:CTP synthetase n=1 Tax=Roseovarius TaxID=74030 RepID=UPI0022A8BD6B|nr:CTP synthetase [Roseovarius sp. EGI FJ00037]MCZ0812966.1 CTP synthetase [Roseovarius sp. EGI FJ00037]